MSPRELFLDFYSVIRLDVHKGSAIDDYGQMEVAADAARAGFTNYQILMARNAALLAIVDRKMTHREPSKNSVAIQLSVHTFGRVTRGRA